MRLLDRRTSTSRLLFPRSNAVVGSSRRDPRQCRAGSTSSRATTRCGSRASMSARSSARQFSRLGVVLASSLVERINLLFVSLLHDSPLHLQGWRQLAVLDREFVLEESDPLRHLKVRE